jgi:hypothetical protein
MGWWRGEGAIVRYLEQLIDARREQVADLRAAQQRIVQLEAENARLQAHFDWLAGHVNTLTIERGALFDKVLQVTWPAVPIIERQELPGADANYRPLPPDVKTRPDPQLGDILAKAREIERDVRRGKEPEVPYGIDFNDMGDEAAERAGIFHAPDGTVR